MPRNAASGLFTVPSSLALDKSQAMQDVKAPIADRPTGIHVSGWAIDNGG